MCGISGIINKTGAPVDAQLLRHITGLVAHRGPDDAGYFLRDNVGFGHRRLSILDLNSRGRQPMCLGDRFWITYNGEIYNYLEIRSELQKLGAEFQTGTDTEVILHAYAQWGIGCLGRFNGMWSFAIYDMQRQEIFMARDRFGVKPLYYSNDAERFAFGSEIKQLLALQSKVRANQKIVIEALLTYVDGHTDATYFADVKTLPQSHYLIYDLKTHSQSLQRYYQLETSAAFREMSLDVATEAFGELFRDAVRLRLRSDVQVGTCLSGGLDSSATSAVAARLYQVDAPRAFIGVHAKSTEARSDESGHAARVARHANLDLVVVEPSVQDFIKTIDEVVYTQEEPFGSPSMFMGWHVFREALARGCKVMLNGQGGDEVLLGYERYYAAILKQRSGLEFLRELRRQAHNSASSPLTAFMHYLYFTRAGMRIGRLKKRSLLTGDAIASYDFAAIKASADSFRDMTTLQKHEITTLQLPHLLRYEDRNSMRHSIETRLPFLDYRLVEAAVSMPTNYKIRDGWTKFILRKAVQNELPADIVWRKNKLGFEAPERTWLTEFEGTMQEAIRGSAILGEIAQRDKIVKEFPQLSLKERWAYFNLAVWERVYNVAWA
jgi:asparagine synthase (glutamine-hydrolysing)